MSTGDTITHTTDHGQPLNTYTCSCSGWVDNEFHHHCTEANARLVGTVRVEESVSATGATRFTIEYRPPADAPGYPVWEPVTTVLTRTQARAGIEHLDDNPNTRAAT